jgi:uncharacterized membrane protein YkoI
MMILARFLLTGGLLLATAASAFAAEHGRCLTPEERRAKIATHAVIPLSKAIRAAKVPRREVVRAALCEQGGILVYVLTVLGRDGKVWRARVDGGNGTVIAGH